MIQRAYAAVCQLRAERNGALALGDSNPSFIVQQFLPITGTAFHHAPGRRDGIGATISAGVATKLFTENARAASATGGDERWRLETDHGILSSPTIVDGTVYIGSRDGFRDEQYQRDGNQCKDDQRPVEIPAMTMDAVIKGML